MSRITKEQASEARAVLRQEHIQDCDDRAERRHQEWRQRILAEKDYERLDADKIYIAREEAKGVCHNCGKKVNKNTIDNINSEIEGHSMFNWGCIHHHKDGDRFICGHCCFVDEVWKDSPLMDYIPAKEKK